MQDSGRTTWRNISLALPALPMAALEQLADATGGRISDELDWLENAIATGKAALQA
jgi:hypothetical protein